MKRTRSDGPGISTSLILGLAFILCGAVFLLGATDWHSKLLGGGAAVYGLGLIVALCCGYVLQSESGGGGGGGGPGDGGGGDGGGGE